jgi:uncharacterized damage-inducible protein DinB
MNRVSLLLCLALAVAPAAADHHEGGSVYGATLAANMEFVSGQLMQLAEALPEEVYAWRPAEGVRATSEVFMHVVGANFLLPVALGVAPPEGLEPPENPFALAREWEAAVTAKADVKARLGESIAFAKNAMATFPEAALDEETDLFGTPMTKRAALLVLLSHSHEHLGQLIAYARSNGVKPPWSEPMPEAPAPAPEG